MAYQAGLFCERESHRIAFLVKRGDPQTASEIFKTYLKSIEAVDNHAAQRSVRGAYVDSLLELAAFIGEPVNGLIQAVTGESVESAELYINTLRVHPNDRHKRKTLLVSSATDEAVLGEARELLEKAGIKIAVR